MAPLAVSMEMKLPQIQRAGIQKVNGVCMREEAKAVLKKTLKKKRI